jgi:hypothetical protein
MSQRRAGVGTSQRLPSLNPRIGSQAQQLYLPIFNKRRIDNLTLFQSPTITNHHKTHRFPRTPNCGLSSQPSSSNIYNTPTRGIKQGIQDTTYILLQNYITYLQHFFFFKHFRFKTWCVKTVNCVASFSMLDCLSLISHRHRCVLPHFPMVVKQKQSQCWMWGPLDPLYSDQLLCMNLERDCFFAVAASHLIFITACQPQGTLENGTRIRCGNIGPIISWHSRIFENLLGIGWKLEN